MSLSLSEADAAMKEEQERRIVEDNKLSVHEQLVQAVSHCWPHNCQEICSFPLSLSLGGEETVTSGAGQREGEKDQ